LRASVGWQFSLTPAGLDGGPPQTLHGSETFLYTLSPT